MSFTISMHIMLREIPKIHSLPTYIRTERRSIGLVGNFTRL